MTERERRDEAIYENYKLVLQRYGDLAKQLPQDFLCAETAKMPLPETFLKTETISKIVNKKKAQ
jgi:hypothetical protein